jgi:predicted ATP-grasp superfamily ATP-dependent carboligase
MPDPEGAAALIETLNKVYELKVDTTDLLKRAKEIKEKLKEVAQRRRRMKRTEEKKGVSEMTYVS